MRGSRAIVLVAGCLGCPGLEQAPPSGSGVGTGPAATVGGAGSSSGHGSGSGTAGGEVGSTAALSATSGGTAAGTTAAVSTGAADTAGGSESSTGARTVPCGVPQTLCHGSVTLTATGCSGAWAVAAADLNGDTFVDVVVTCWQSDEVSVLMGDGTGALAVGVPYSTGPGSRPEDVVIALLDGDTFPDVITAHRDGDNVGVLYGVGDGTLAVVQSFSTGNRTQGVAAADLDGDNRLDIVAAVRDDHNLSVFLSDVATGFASEVEIATPSTRPESVFLAEIDDQPGHDVAWASPNGDVVVVHSGDTVGGFDAGMALNAGNQPNQVSGGDFDEDGDVDLVVTNQGDDTVSYFANNGDGTFAVQQTFAVGVQPIWAFADDVDADGRMDVVTANRMGGLSVLLGDGGGSFAAAVALDSMGEPRGVVATDLNGDGVPDFVFSSSGSVGTILSAPL